MRDLMLTVYFLFLNTQQVNDSITCVLVTSHKQSLGHFRESVGLTE